MPTLFRRTFRDKKTGKLRKTKKWYGQYTDANGAVCRVPLSANKSAAQGMLAKLVEKVEFEKAGIRDPFEAHRKTTMAQHRDDWLKVLTARGRDKDYTDLKRARVTAILLGCEFTYALELSAEKLERFLERLRAGEISPPVEDKKKQGKPKKLSVQTTNDYLQAISQLCVWMVENDRLERNPFDRVKKGNAERDRRRVRRVLDATELQTLITETQASTKLFRGLTGEDRAILYAVAAATGYRKGELAILTPHCFNLDAKQPTVDLGAEHTKNGKAASQPLSVPLATVLRQYIAGKLADAPVWPGTWSERGAKMFKADAKAAKIPLEVTTKDGKQVLDFHSLRGTFATLLDALDISLKGRQDLMRHSDPRLTLNRYTRVNQSELEQVAAQIPVAVPMPKPATQADSACTDLAQTSEGDRGRKGATGENEEAREQVPQPAGEPGKQGNCLVFWASETVRSESHLWDLNPRPPLYESGALPLC
jgi:integrase